MNKYIIALALMTSFISGSVNATLIDDFSDGKLHIVADSFDNYQTSSSAFGGGRSVSIIKQGVNAKADIITRLGLYAHSSNVRTSATSTISWSNATGVDLIESTNNAFALDIYSNDLNNSNFALSVTDSAKRSTSYTLFEADAGIHNIAFSQFSNIDFLQITDISLQIIGGLESDIVISSLSTTSTGPISAVPTPTALILFTSSLAILSLSRRN